uniref:Beta-defensin-like domain-containing protein n=1 Tax=Podarcis muralis TaxID=64176 RepID=A0A670HMK4_PODMU
VRIGMEGMNADVIKTFISFHRLPCFSFFIMSSSHGDAQAPEDTIACGRGGGGCQVGACRPGFQNVGTCKGGTMSCCRW